MVLRRRNNFLATRTHRNQGFVLDEGSVRGEQTIWRTSQLPPPSYDHIYEASLPVNPLPDYDSISQQKSKKKEENRSEQVIEQNENAADEINHSNQSLNLCVTESNPSSISRNNFLLSSSSSNEQEDGKLSKKNQSSVESVNELSNFENNNETEAEKMNAAVETNESQTNKEMSDQN